MTPRPLVIFGAGGLGREVLSIVEACSVEAAEHEMRGFLSEVGSDWGKEVNGYPVLGGFEWLDAQPGDCDLVCAIGAPAVRRRIIDRCREMGVSFATLLHPRATLSNWVSVGDGAVIAAGANVTTQVDIGNHALINLGTTIGHDSSIGDFATLSPGVHISGRVQVGEGCEIGTGAVVIPGVRVGSWSVIGAGAAVVKDVPPDCTVVGVPARLISERPRGWHLVEDRTSGP